MKTLFTISTLVFTVMFSSPSFADADYGKAFYDDGDFATALGHFKKSAEQGDATSQYYLGVMYENASGVTQDYKLAVKWLRESAKQGFSGAQHSLGLMYGQGLGVTQDEKKAVKWLRKAAKQGHAAAQSALDGLGAR
jgi:TPR repeat protein